MSLYNVKRKWSQCGADDAPLSLLHHDMDYGRNFYRPDYTTQTESASPSGAVLAILLLGSLIVLGGASHRLHRIFSHALDSMQGVGLLALQRSKLSRPTVFQNTRKPENGEASIGQSPSSQDLEGSDYIYSGLLNTSTTCYLNSSLQLLASSPSYVAYLRSIVRTALACDDAETPVAKALLDLLNKLNTPVRAQSILQPRQLMDCLLESGDARSHASRNRRRILQGSGQQDAQEFFLLLTEAVEEEKTALLLSVEDKAVGGSFATENAQNADEPSRNHVVRPVVLATPANLMPYISVSFFVRFGVTVCRVYSSPHKLHELRILRGRAPHTVRTPVSECPKRGTLCSYLSTTSSYESPQRTCRLEDMLAEISQLELIDEFTCRRCSVVATQIKLQETLSVAREDTLSASKKKRVREMQKNLNLIDAAVENGDFEHDFADAPTLKVERAVGPASKQAMLARTPKTLVLHISRSTFFDSYGGGAKNNCQVRFPEYLDMTPYVTSAQLIGDPKHSMGVQSHTSSESASSSNLYRLQALVVHFGSHSYGHYVSIKRRPPSQRPEDAAFVSSDWFRISDETITHASMQEVLTANPFLLLYERIATDSRVAQHAMPTKPSVEQVQSWQLMDP